MKIFPICLLLFTMMAPLAARSGYEFFLTSRFARPIGLGHAYTAVAEGVETTFYNSAGLSFNEGWGLAYSYGNGLQFTVPVTPYDLALTTPGFAGIGHFALSVHSLEIESMGTVRYSLYRLHYSIRPGDTFSIGASLNYFQLGYEPAEFEAEQSEAVLDLNLSALYVWPDIFLSGGQDRLKIGLQITNLFGSKIDDLNIKDIAQEKHPLSQSLSFGLSYTWQPAWQAVKGSQPLRLLLAADLVYDNSIKNESWQPERRLVNIGIELLLLEQLALRYGRENQADLIEAGYTTPQYPVSRIGVGLIFPLQRIFDLKNKMNLSLDYAHGFWQKQAELDEVIRLFGMFSGNESGSDRYAWSLQIQAVL